MRWAFALAFAAGALLNCAFAPLNWWPLAILCPAILIWLWEADTPRFAAWAGLWFGLGLISFGTWWLYVSIRVVGGTPLWLTALLLALAWLWMASYYALVGFVGTRYLPRTGAWRWLVGLPGLWLLVEWLRGWFLTGFPWLSLGYSQTDTWLAGFAPVGGVYALSALLLLGSGALVALVRGSGSTRWVALGLLLAPWPVGWLLGRVEWTQAAGPAVSVAILQGAVAESIKWDETVVQPTMDLYTRLNEQALGARLIVWPESAVPQFANDMPNYLRQVYGGSRQHGSDVIMGVLRFDAHDEAYDSLMAVGDEVEFYDKHQLVPFAEFFPVPDFIRSWMRLRNLPYSDFSRGSAHQPAIAAGDLWIAPSICYEDGYGSQNLGMLRRAQLLVNVTNDGWFGRSWARYQHLQISRMRALETRRPMLRAANDGVSALIGAHGEVLARGAEFVPIVVRGTVQPRSGLVPYAWWGNLPVVVLATLGLVAAMVRRYRS